MNYLKSFIKEGFNYGGCTNRKDFWMTILFVFIINIIINIILAAIIFLFGRLIPESASFVNIILYVILSVWGIVVFACSMSLITRRLHDTNHDGIWLIGALIFQIFWIPVLIFCLSDTVTTQTNKFKK